MITFERKIYQKLLQWKAESQGNFRTKRIQILHFH